MDCTELYTEHMAVAIYYAAIKVDPNRSKYEPFTAQECKQLAIDRVAEIRAHNKKLFPELEEFAVYFYTEVCYEKVAIACNKKLEKAWEWD